MNTEEFNKLKKGDRVRVLKSGKVYEMTYLEAFDKTASSMKANYEKWKADGLEFATDERCKEELDRCCPGGCNYAYFVQIRANSKGIVCHYGPSTRLLAKNIEGVN